MWHKLSLFAKILILVIGLTSGMYLGYKKGVSDGLAMAGKEGNTIEVNVDAGKVKDGGTLDINLKDLNQQQTNQDDNSNTENKTKKKEKKKFLGIF